jgi:hypothetical protein
VVGLGFGYLQQGPLGGGIGARRTGVRAKLREDERVGVARRRSVAGRRAVPDVEPAVVDERRVQRQTEQPLLGEATHRHHPVGDVHKLGAPAVLDQIDLSRLVGDVELVGGLGRCDDVDRRGQPVGHRRQPDRQRARRPGTAVCERCLPGVAVTAAREWRGERRESAEEPSP